MEFVILFIKKKNNKRCGAFIVIIHGENLILHFKKLST